MGEWLARWSCSLLRSVVRKPELGRVNAVACSCCPWQMRKVVRHEYAARAKVIGQSTSPQENGGELHYDIVHHYNLNNIVHYSLNVGG